jgi:hypothetical protein
MLKSQSGQYRQCNKEAQVCLPVHAELTSSQKNANDFIFDPGRYLGIVYGIWMFKQFKKPKCMLIIANLFFTLLTSCNDVAVYDLFIQCCGTYKNTTEFGENT